MSTTEILVEAKLQNHSAFEGDYRREVGPAIRDALLIAQVAEAQRLADAQERVATALETANTPSAVAAATPPINTKSLGHYFAKFETRIEQTNLWYGSQIAQLVRTIMLEHVPNAYYPSDITRILTVRDIERILQQDGRMNDIGRGKDPYPEDEISAVLNELLATGFWEV